MLTSFVFTKVRTHIYSAALHRWLSMSTLSSPFLCLWACSVQTIWGLKKKKKKHHTTKPNHTSAFMLPYSVSCSKPYQRKMQQQRALEALSCIALNNSHVYTRFHITQTACPIFSVHLMHRKLTKHFRHKLQLYDIHHFVQLLDAGSFSSIEN